MIGTSVKTRNTAVRGASLLKETREELRRMERAGHTIENDLPWSLIDPILRELKAVGELSNLVFLGAAGAREVVSGSVATLYDWSGNSNDATQSDSAKRPTETTSADYGGRVVLSPDGSDDYLEDTDFPSVATAAEHIAVGAFAQTGSTAYITDGWNVDASAPDNSHRQLVRQYQSTNNLYAGSVLDGNDADTSPHIFDAIMDGSNSLLEVDGTQEASGSGGTNTLDRGLILLAGDRGGSNLGGEVALIMLIDGRLSSSVRSNLRSVFNSYYNL